MTYKSIAAPPIEAQLLRINLRTWSCTQVYAQRLPIQFLIAQNAPDSAPPLSEIAFCLQDKYPCSDPGLVIASRFYHAAQTRIAKRTSTLVITNLPFERWVEVLGCERLTGATLDRLTHRCHVLEANGQSYRLNDAKRRRQVKPSK